MSSGRETAIAALASALEVTGATVWRDTDRAREIPDAGLITVAEGDYTPEVVMSPLQYLHDMPVALTVEITRASEPDRDAALDDLLRGISSALLADTTLGGAVELLTIGEPTFAVFEADGAGKAAHLAVTLTFTTAGSPLA